MFFLIQSSTKNLTSKRVSYEKIDVTEKPEYLQKYPIYTALGLVLNGKLEFTGIYQRKKNSLKN
ncbi:MAG: hypothetical protein ACRD92_02235 [Nitrosopumilaceae archaeon]